MINLVSDNWKGLNNFTGFLFLDNVEAVTLKPNPLNDIDFVNSELIRYMNDRGFEYSLYVERAGCYHYHGVIAYSNWNMWNNFRRWFNRIFGYINVSRKDTGNLNGWYDYCTKVHDQELIDNTEYMF